MERVRISRVAAGGGNITEVKNIDDTHMSTPPRRFLSFQNS